MPKTGQRKRSPGPHAFPGEPPSAWTYIKGCPCDECLEIERLRSRHYKRAQRARAKELKTHAGRR
jgi:hypothetical protein